MRIHTKTLILIGGIILVGGGCSDTTALPLPELIITNTWDVEGDLDRDFSFTADTDEPATSGTFSGTEFIEFDENPLTGSWSNGEVTFTVGGTRNNEVYYGTFTDLANRITVSSNSETITLVRQTN